MRSGAWGFSVWEDMALVPPHAIPQKLECRQAASMLEAGFPGITRMELSRPRYFWSILSGVALTLVVVYLLS